MLFALRSKILDLCSAEAKMSRRVFSRLGPRKTLTDLVHQQLRTDVIRGRFLSGEFISTGKIAKDMGISSMPVRAALTRLETEGLVVIVPQRGIKVSGVSVAELKELFLIRSRLEGLAAYLANSQLTDEDICELKRLQREMAKYAKRNDAKNWLTANEQWHHLIIRATGNKQLTRLLLDLWHRGMSRRTGAPNVPGHMARRLAEHEGLMAAFERRDGELVERLWRDHIIAGGEEITKYFEAAQAPAKPARRESRGSDGLHNTRRGRAPATDGAKLRREGS
jgi:DNA-binding GntR family transcriptional regulator